MVDNVYYGKIATGILILIYFIDSKYNILKVSSKIPENMINKNKNILLIIAFLLLVFIGYISDIFTYNYFNLDKINDKISECCYEKSYWDAILAGISEELVFRLVIFNIILIKIFKLSLNKSIIISSILFGLMHINQYISFGTNIYTAISTIISSIPSGAIFAYVYANTNLTTAIILHFLYDMFCFVFLRCNPTIYKKMLFINH